LVGRVKMGVDGPEIRRPGNLQALLGGEAILCQQEGQNGQKRFPRTHTAKLSLDRCVAASSRTRRGSVPSLTFCVRVNKKNHTPCHKKTLVECLGGSAARREPHCR